MAEINNALCPRREQHKDFLIQFKVGDFVGLYNADTKKKPNLLLLTISSWLKEKGVVVEWYESSRLNYYTYIIYAKTNNNKQYQAHFPQLKKRKKLRQKWIYAWDIYRKHKWEILRSGIDLNLYTPKSKPYAYGWCSVPKNEIECRVEMEGRCSGTCGDRKVFFLNSDFSFVNTAFEPFDMTPGPVLPTDHYMWNPFVNFYSQKLVNSLDYMGAFKLILYDRDFLQLENWQDFVRTQLTPLKKCFMFANGLTLRDYTFNDIKDICHKFNSPYSVVYLNVTDVGPKALGEWSHTLSVGEEVMKNTSYKKKFLRIVFYVYPETELQDLMEFEHSCRELGVGAPYPLFVVMDKEHTLNEILHFCRWCNRPQLYWKVPTFDQYLKSEKIRLGDEVITVRKSRRDKCMNKHEW